LFDKTAGFFAPAGKLQQETAYGLQVNRH